MSIATEGSLSGYRNNRYPLVKRASSSEKSSRASSLLSVASNLSDSNDWTHEIDYKMLYEKEKIANEKLIERIKQLEELENENTINDHEQKDQSTDEDNHGSHEVSKNERLNLERRILELENIVQTVEQLRLDNQRLKEENGALIRVISKLSR